ncbi:BTAD domain-containing putative transcriptional regulator [Streptomyces sp. NPDC059578]|uniref:AfsR/SARP family transcriptional regulator n=1 Tax=Streptomyces sp. NPDC059578 TaxID=3346874 RepID=UPI00369BCA89
MHFGVLGPLVVWTADGVPVAVPGAKARTLLARLLVDPGRPVSTDRLVDDLWGPDSPPEHPRNALQGQVSRLRAALERVEAGGRELLVGDAAGYRLRIDPVVVDTVRFAELVRRGRSAGGAEERVAALSQALGLWRGDAFAGYADLAFARAAAHRLEEDRLSALEDRLAARAELGDHRGIIGEAEELVAAHPLRERLRAIQLRALYGAGRQSDALAGYESLRRTLDEELGLSPGAELTALHGAILRHDPTLTAAPPDAGPPGGAPAAAPVAEQPHTERSDAGGSDAGRSGTGPSATGPSGARVGTVRGNLPAPVAALVGRAGDATEVRQWLAHSRLVTLTGPGGVGKTRLAVEVARGVGDAFPDGVWLAELQGVAPLCGPDGSETVTAVAEALLTVLRIPEATDGGPPRPALDRLGRALRERRLLLVLDNCEHVVEAVAEVAARLLSGAPDLSVLATSQEPLGAVGESVRPVAPLAAEDAEALFLARAAVPPGFAGDPENARAVSALCARLDGLPLALELAASRVRSLGVHGLLARLDDRFALLSGGPRTAPERQRTLRAVIDWSWDLLSPDERTVLRRLSVAAGGCTVEAAEEVCGGDGIATGNVLDLLARLVDRSLVVLTDHADGPVYRLLESVRAYGAERLVAAGEADAVRERHGRHYARLARRAAPLLRGPEQQRWLERLDGAGADLRLAVEQAVRVGAWDRALRTVNALVWPEVLRGRPARARRAVDGVLSAVPEEAPYARERARAVVWRTGLALMAATPRDDVDPVGAGGIGAALAPYRQGAVDDPAGYASALWFLGSAQMGAGDVDTGEELVDRALEGFAALGDDWGTAAALSVRTRHAMARGDLDAVRRDGERSALLFRAVGDPWGLLQTVFPLAALASINGDYGAATRLHREGLEIAERLGLSGEAAKRHTGLGRLALLAGDHQGARVHHERALRLAREGGLRSGEADARLGLGLGARRAGALDEAAEHFGALLSWFREVDYGPGVALVLAELGFVAQARGDARAAGALHREGLGVARGLGDARAIALALEGLAGAGLVAGEGERAAVLLGAAAAARDSVGAPLPPAERGDVDRIAAGARAALGGAVFDLAFARGAALPADGPWPLSG